jgi:CYTH domain-containing protein
MPLEIERKFLVDPALWTPQGPGTVYQQGYIGTRVPGVTVRIRLLGDEARLTLKGPATGAVRAEYEYPIPADHAAQILETLCDPPFIHKTRYLVEHEGDTWEVDVFAGDNEGLVVAELELQSEHQEFARPAWLGHEVTDDLRYSNVQLTKRPYRLWRDEA